jgi:8-oxo-dGTP diphosphatase
MVYVNGEVRQQFALCFHALPLAGEPRPDHDETIGADWFTKAEFPNLDTQPGVWLRIRARERRHRHRPLRLK